MVRGLDIFTEWFKKIKLWNLRDQYFREYYRSGNVFLYRVDGKFKTDDFAKLVNQIGILGDNKIPLKYIVLNPFDIVAKRSSTFATGAYEKIYISHGQRDVVWFDPAADQQPPAAWHRSNRWSALDSNHAPAGHL